MFENTKLQNYNSVLIIMPAGDCYTKHTEKKTGLFHGRRFPAVSGNFHQWLRKTLLTSPETHASPRITCKLIIPQMIPRKGST